MIWARANFWVVTADFGPLFVDGAAAALWIEKDAVQVWAAGDGKDVSAWIVAVN